MILIIAPEDDTHAQVVAQRLEGLGEPSLIWNTTWFPWRERVTWSPEEPMRCRGLNEFSLSDVRRIWWRRFRWPSPSPQIADEDVKRFCAGEAAELLRVLRYSDVPITNHPDAERAAEVKPRQLRCAQRLGLSVPRTVISNDSEAILEFMDEIPRTIVKTLRGSYPHAVDTREVERHEMEDPDKIGLAPTLVQELVECIADIRVTVVGQEVFAAQLVRENANQEVDWRMTASGWKPHSLPDEVSARLIGLLRELDLETGSFDLRQTPEGDYVFLEVNPTGQFLFLEIDAGLSISEAFARHLSRDRQ